MDKIKYDPLYKFIVSIGIAIVSLPFIFIAWILNNNDMLMIIVDKFTDKNKLENTKLNKRRPTMEKEENLSEEDIKNIYITPALTRKWDLQTQIRSEVYFTDGRIIVNGNTSKRAKGKKADYILYHNNNQPIAVIEAKKNILEVGHGIQQAIDYAEILDIPFAYSSNGKAFLEHDMITGKEREISMGDFPSPEELWSRIKLEKNITEEEQKIIDNPYYYAPGSKRPRYYQRVAINRTVQAIANGQKRILLVMATGTGKTFTAFQIIHRLRAAGMKKKILYLADRNLLIDQTMAQDFQPFEKVMTKIEHRKMDSSYEIYMALYQQLTNGAGLDIFKQFKKDFFDLIIVDECHRGSAAEDSDWRRILEYFDSATQIGMTATPKETKEVSNIQYFGEPIYTYSLKEGINDGFLAPYKVVRVNIDKDIIGYRPEIGKKDIDGNQLEDKTYCQEDFDKKIIIDERTQLVAKRITEYLKNTNRYNKTIVFCIDVEHAARMRQALINENADMVKENSNYIMQITGDNREGKAQLDNFTDVSSKYPTIVTTSKLLTTGADCKMCKLVVLDSMISSITEFKQIIGRGTRIRESDGKTYFTIMDFRNASKLFNDPEFDGMPVSIIDLDGRKKIPKEIDNQQKEDNKENQIKNTIRKPGDTVDIHKKIRVNGVDINIVGEFIRYYDKGGREVTESIRDFSKKSILNEYPSIEDFINNWNSADKKQNIIDNLEDQGVLLDELRKDVENENIGEFDLILYVAYGQKPITRYERAQKVLKRGHLYQYSENQQRILSDLITKYSEDNVLDITDIKILEIQPFDAYGSPMKIVKEFGGKEEYIKAVKQLEKELYSS